MYEARIISKADYPVVIKYKGEFKVVSPREQFNIVKKSDIEGMLPSELRMVSY